MFDKKVETASIAAIDRNRIFIFLAITFSLTLAPYLVIFLSNGRLDSYREGQRLRVLLVALMFAPMLANIATRLITREGWANTLLRVNFRCGRWRYYLAAWFLPPVAAIVGGAIYYLLFPGIFDPSMTDYRQLGLTLFGNEMEPLGFFITQVASAIVKPIWISILLYSFAEEFGWRAYLLPKLITFGPSKAALLVGIIHGVWHWPSIIFVGSNFGFGYWGAPVTGPLLFVLVVTLQSMFYTWITLRSGSVWPAAICHGAINAWNTLVCIFVSGEPKPLIGPGFQGVVGMLGYGVLAFLAFHKLRSLRQPTSVPADMALASNSAASGNAAD